ncbi:CDP-alcohol phosphatidyltransferase family protein [Microbacterium lacticum]
MSFGASLRSLRSAQKHSRGVSLYSRWINRPLGRVFAALAVQVGLGPNAVTVVSAVVTFGGIAVLAWAPPTITTGIGGALLLVLGFALDSADGQVARLTGRGSRAGEWLDHVVDAAKMVGLHGAVLVAFWRTGEAGGWMALALAFQFVAVVFFSALTLYSLLATSESPSAESSPSTLRAIALLPADYGVLAVSFVLWGVRPAFLTVYTVLFVATTLIAAALCLKWFRSLARASS